MIEKKDNWDGHKEVKDFIYHVSELNEINAQFKKIEQEYENKPYDDKYYKTFNEKKVFDDIVWNYVFYKHELRKQLDERPFTGLSVKEEIFEYAKKYLDSKFIHNYFLTSSILTQVIDTELVPLEYEVNGIAHLMVGEVAMRNTFGQTYLVKWSNLLPYPWNKLVSFFLFLVPLIIGILAIIFFISVDFNWLAWIVGIFLVWNYIGKIFILVNSAKTRVKLATLAINLRFIRNEINSHSYDGKVLTERMKKLESEGLIIHSLVYPLLELSSKN